MSGEGGEVRDDEEAEVDENGNSNSAKQKEVKCQGISLYTSLHFLVYTGGYRFLDSKEFSKEISFGYTIELFVSLIPQLFCQAFNNTSMLNKPTAL